MMLAKVRELTERMRRSNHCVRHGWAYTLFSSTVLNIKVNYPGEGDKGKEGVWTRGEDGRKNN